METFLRKLMQVLGRWVETFAGALGKKCPSHEKTSEVLLTPSQGVKLPASRLRKIVETLENREIVSLTPNLSGKKALHLSTAGTQHWQMLQQKGAGPVIDFDGAPFYVQPPAGVTPPEEWMRIRGSCLKIPFPEDSFDFVLFLAATPQRDQSLEWMREIARILKDGSRTVLSLPHPYLEYALNPKAGFIHSVEQYYMGLRKVGIFVEEIRESKADDSLHSLFVSEKDEAGFQAVRGFPIILSFRAIRLKRR